MFAGAEAEAYAAQACLRVGPGQDLMGGLGTLQGAQPRDAGARAEGQERHVTKGCGKDTAFTLAPSLLVPGAGTAIKVVLCLANEHHLLFPMALFLSFPFNSGHRAVPLPQYQETSNSAGRLGRGEWAAGGGLRHRPGHAVKFGWADIRADRLTLPLEKQCPCSHRGGKWVS